MPVRLEPLAMRIGALNGRVKTLRAQHHNATETARLKTEGAYEVEKVMAIIRGLEGTWRERFEAGLAGVVSHGLTAVFGEPILVRLETTTFRDATALEILIEQNGAVSSVLDAKGGSLVQVLGFLLRVLLLVSVNPPLERVLVLDEPFAMVSEEYRPALAELVRELSERLGVQFVIITHEREFVDAADVAYEVYDTGGHAAARTIKAASEEAVL